MLVRVFSADGPIYFQQEGPNHKIATGTESGEMVLQRLLALAAHGTR
jgi:hypothetical protein